MSDVVKLFSLKELSEARKQGQIEELVLLLPLVQNLFYRAKAKGYEHRALSEIYDRVEMRLLELKK
jgi:hypothetical protein